MIPDALDQRLHLVFLGGARGPVFQAQEYQAGILAVPREVEARNRECGLDQIAFVRVQVLPRSEEHTSELQSLMRISYAVFCLKKKNKQINKITYTQII